MYLHLDCAGGINGGMLLAALAHLGVDFAPLTAALLSVGVDCRLEISPELRDGGPGRVASAVWNAAAGRLRRPPDIAAVFDAVDVPARARALAHEALEALTGAEAYARRIPPENVRFHEAAAVEALVGFLGAAFGIVRLGVERVTASALPWFGGSVEGAHGPIPLPAPATAYLLRGKPVFASGAREELITAAGAAMLEALVKKFVPGPVGVPVSMGTGYGSGSSSMGLRAWLVKTGDGGADHALGGHEPVVQLESHIDHLNGEDLGLALQALSAMPEVLDVLWLPGVGKKNRPAGLLRVLCLPPQREAVTNAVLRHTHTLGLRMQTLERVVAPRRAAQATVAGHCLAAKEYVVEGEAYVRPEADALAELAHNLGVGVPALRNGRRG